MIDINMLIYSTIASNLCEAFHGALHTRKIKFRPTRPRSPHGNGTVERSQQTDKLAFYVLVEDKALSEQLRVWQQSYNEDRPHRALGGKAP